MITLIAAGNPGPFTGPTGNNTWLVDGAEPLLVDAGVGDSSHIAALEARLDGRPLARIFLTHSHRDHAAGVPQLRVRWPRVEVITGNSTGKNFVLAGDRPMEIISTPGHSSDHACLWDPVDRVLFAGDLLISSGTVMLAASSGGGLREYLASLQRVRQLNPARIYPGHGPIIDNPADLIDQYIAHRFERERQVIAALEAAPSTVESLVQQIYPLLDPAVVPAAEETLLAHLRKLEEEDRVQQADGVWMLRRSRVARPE